MATMKTRLQRNTPTSKMNMGRAIEILGVNRTKFGLECLVLATHGRDFAPADIAHRAAGKFVLKRWAAYRNSTAALRHGLFEQHQF